MTVRVYRWDDASAPQLNNAAESLINILDACLVNGYGAKPSLGWTKPFSGTNLAVYRMAGGNQRYLRVSDSSSVAATMRGYGAMTDVSTGTDEFPTAAQASSGINYYKSSNSTTRPWVLIGDDKCFYMIGSSAVTAADGISTHLRTNSSASGIFFGDFVSFLPGDVWNTALIGATSNGATASYLGQRQFNSSTTTVGHYVIRNYTQTGGSVNISKTCGVDLSGGSNLGIGVSPNNYPDPVTGGFDLMRAYLSDAAGIVRGYLPGFWGPRQGYVGNFDDTFSGKVGTPLAGKTFLVLPAAYNGGTTPCATVCIETSNTWS